MTRLTVSLIEPDVEATRRAARCALAGGADLVELRIDHLRSIDVGSIGKLVNELPPGRAVVTCRSRSQGGRYGESEGKRIEVLARAAGGRDVLVDLEFDTWQASEPGRKRIGEALGGDWSRLILSDHDFEGRPASPRKRLAEIRQANPAGVAKLAWTGADAADSLEALELMRSGGGRTIAVCMGQAGVASRVLAGKFGGFLTYCSLSAGAEAAPGQVDLADMKNLYRWSHLGTTTQVLGVVAWPVGHSLSPLIHNMALTELGIDAVYVPLPIQPTYEAFAGFVQRARACAGLHMRGLSVTIPHKSHALRLAGEVERLAERIGAANTLVFDPDDAGAAARATNTDYAGALGALVSGAGWRREELAGRRCAVLGAGGAARAVVAGLADCGCEVTVYNRTEARARALAEEFGCAWRPFEKRERLDAEAVVNTTSVGMHPNVKASPLPPDALRKGMVVFETIYNPLETLLLKQAKQAGCCVIDGVGMFVEQAALQFEAWTGRSAPRELMRRVVVERLADG